MPVRCFATTIPSSTYSGCLRGYARDLRGDASGQGVAEIGADRPRQLEPAVEEVPHRCTSSASTAETSQVATASGGTVIGASVGDGRGTGRGSTMRAGREVAEALVVLGRR